MAKKSAEIGDSAKSKPKARSLQRSDKAVGAKSAPIFVLKVSLTYNKSIWRRIAVRGEQTLEDLHEAIYDAFDRYDEHLYSFYLAPPGTTGEARWRTAVEFACDQMFEHGDRFDGKPEYNAAETTIQSMGLKRQRVFRYVFDYGDEWRHDIAVEQLDGEPEKGKYPKILEKHGKSPPQYDYGE